MTDDGSNAACSFRLAAASSSASSNPVAGGIVLLLLSLICLGTWPALLRLCTYDEDWPSLSSSRGSDPRRRRNAPLGAVRRALAQRRHPCHAYIDYAAAYFIFSLTVPIIISQVIGTFLVDEGENVPTNDVADDDYCRGVAGVLLCVRRIPLILVAMVGGSLLALGNLSTQWSTAVFGAPLTTVLAIQASLCVVVGTSLNYLLEPGKTARPALLACGVSSFLVAIVLSLKVQSSYDACKDGTDGLSDDESDEVGISMHNLGSLGEYLACRNDGDLQKGSEGYHPSKDMADQSSSYDHKRQASNNGDGPSFGAYVESDPGPVHRKSDPGPVHRKSTSTGMVVAFLGGMCFGFFSPAFNIAVNDPFGDGDGGGLSVATANACFAVAFAASSVLWNAHLMRHPPPDAHPPVPSSNLREYAIESGFRGRALALSAGVICALGNALQFQGGRMAGYAASDLVQAFPIVATAWDVLLFGEFRGASGEVVLHLRLMYIAYMGGIGLLALSIGR